MKQNTLKATKGSRKARKRVGRGGITGTYSGRGMKGQNSRSGGGVRPGFEGGQTPLIRRMPKLKGFKNFNRTDFLAVNVNRLNERFEDGAKIDIQALIEKGFTKRPVPVKLLGTGKIEKKFTITVDAASGSAIKKVEKAGGKVVLTGEKKTEKTEKKDS